MTLLRSYNPEREEEIRQLVARSVAGLPSTLSKPIASLMREVEKDNFSAGMNYALDFLEISVQFVSCCLFVLLQDAEEALPADSRAMKAVVDKIDAKRSLSFGDWVNDIFNPIVRAAAKELPDNPLAKSVRSVLFSRGANRLLGTKAEPSVVRIRNEYKGHSTTLSNEIYRGVVFTLEPQVLAMLEAVRPLQDFSFEVSGGHFRFTSPDGSRADLHPLVFHSGKGYEYVFQSLKDEEISYISSDEDAVTLIDDSLNADFDRLLQRSSPSFDISREMNWTEMRSLMQKESGRFLSRVYREKKYNRELFVERKGLSALLDEFTAGDRTLFPLLGEAGQGKTNQLCWWTEEISRSDDAVLIFSSSDFASETLPDALRRIFGASPRKDPARIAAELHKRAAEQGRRVFIFFDAVNECLRYKDASAGNDGPTALYEAFRELFIRPEFPRFKLLFTCRSYSWKTLFQLQMKRDAHLMFSRGGQDSEVHGFSDAELREAWGIYQNLYQMSGDFDSLSKVSLVRLRDPLILKIACTNHVGTALPEDLSAYSSIALFADMTEKIANSYAGRQQHEIMLTIAGYLLGRYESGTPSDRIDRGELLQAWDDPSAPLHKLSRLIYKQGGLTVAYTELLNKPERPILRYIETPDGRAEIQFIYERFLEYLMAVEFVRRNSRDGKVIPPEAYIRALGEESGSVVFMGALRNALIIDWMSTGDNGTLVSLVRDYGDNYEVSLLTGEVLNVLIRENYEDALFGLMRRMLDEPLSGRGELIAQFNGLTRLIQGNKADEFIIARHKALRKELAPVLHLGQTATVSIVNGMFLSDWFNGGLYRSDPYELLWKLVCNPLLDIGNDACMYVYYLHNKRRTLDFTPLRENISVLIVRRMFQTVRSHGLVATAADPKLRSQAVSFVETGARLAMMLIIDELLAGQPGSSARVAELMDDIRGLMSFLTWKYRLVRMLMPFFSMILRRQITFQSSYVNNAVEYQTFWDDAVVPPGDGGDGRWCRKDAAALAGYFVSGGADGFRSFRKECPKVLKAYMSGDSFSYFILERLLAVAGIADWENIAPVVRGFFTDSYRRSEWFDYSQMSMLYVLYQVQKKSAAYNPELMEIYSREAADWTRRCKGVFKGRNSHKANTTGLYKRNVMNWYCDVYCTHSGDNVPHEGDAQAAPVFHSLIDEAIAAKDKPLLYHLLANISELVSDNGFILTALSLLLHVMDGMSDSSLIAEFDAMDGGRGENASQPLVQAIGNVLSTAKNYFPAEVDSFLKQDLAGSAFPGVEKYRDEVLNYSPGGETLSDLFTHSFGNFVIWSLVNLDPFKEFAARVVGMSAEASDCFEWYDMVIRDGFRTVFNVKL